MYIFTRGICTLTENDTRRNRRAGDRETPVPRDADYKTKRKVSYLLSQKVTKEFA